MHYSMSKPGGVEESAIILSNVDPQPEPEVYDIKISLAKYFNNEKLHVAILDGIVITMPSV